MNKRERVVFKELIRKYNILACPKNGIPYLTPTGRPSRVGFKVRNRNWLKT